MNTLNKNVSMLISPRDPGKSYFLFFPNETVGMFTASYSSVRSQDNLLPENRSFIKDIQKLSNLPANWDSCNAAPVSLVSIGEATLFVKALDLRGLTPDVVAPGPNEEVMVMLRKESGDELECIFYPDRTVFVWFMQNEKPRQQRVASKDWEGILHEWMFGESRR